MNWFQIKIKRDSTKIAMISHHKGIAIAENLIKDFQAYMYMCVLVDVGIHIFLCI